MRSTHIPVVSFATSFSWWFEALNQDVQPALAVHKSVEALSNRAVALGPAPPGRDEHLTQALRLRQTRSPVGQQFRQVRSVYVTISVEIWRACNDRIADLARLRTRTPISEQLSQIRSVNITITVKVRRAVNLKLDEVNFVVQVDPTHILAPSETTEATPIEPCSVWWFRHRTALEVYPADVLSPCEAGQLIGADVEVDAEGR